MNSRTKRLTARGGPLEGRDEHITGPVSRAESTGVTTSGGSTRRGTGASRKRMLDARTELLETERRYISDSKHNEVELLHRAESLQRQAAEIMNETSAKTYEHRARASALKLEARLNAELAGRIREIAERSALSLLDRIKEASDSMMNHARLASEDLGEIMRSEAAEQASRLLSEIRASNEALDDENRAVEYMGMVARYRDSSAA